MGVRELPRSYSRLLVAAVASNFGDGIRLTALPLLATTVTRDPLEVGAVTAATMAPWLLGPIGGTIVDRGDRARLMVLGQAARAIAVAALGAAVLTGMQRLWMVYAVAALIGVGEVLVDSALQASIPSLVAPEQLERANGRMVAGMTISGEVVGGPVGGVLFATAASLPFFVDAVTFTMAAVLLVGLQIRPRVGAHVADGGGLGAAVPPPPTFLTDVREGLSALWNDRLLRPLAVVAGLVNVATSAAASLLVLLALDDLGLTEAGFGVLLGVGAVGGLIGSLGADRARARFGRPAVLLGAAVTVAVGQWLLALAPTPALAAAGLATVTFAGGTFNVVGRSLRQAVVPERLLGRVIASFRVIGLSGMPIGALLGGVLARATSVRLTFALAAVLLTVVAGGMAATVRRIPPEHR